MRPKDLLWILAYPIYQLVGTLRHEAAHALAAVALGGRITAFVFWPTPGRWGSMSWVGPSGYLTTAAPYLLDLATFLAAFAIVARWNMRRWLALNLIALGAISPLVNTAYNYAHRFRSCNDTHHLLERGDALLVHGYFVATMGLYLAGLFWLFTRAPGLRPVAPAARSARAHVQVPVAILSFGVLMLAVAGLYALKLTF